MTPEQLDAIRERVAVAEADPEWPHVAFLGESAVNIIGDVATLLAEVKRLNGVIDTADHIMRIKADKVDTLTRIGNAMSDAIGNYATPADIAAKAAWDAEVGR